MPHPFMRKERLVNIPWSYDIVLNAELPCGRVSGWGVWAWDYMAMTIASCYICKTPSTISPLVDSASLSFPKWHIRFTHLLLKMSACNAHQKFFMLIGDMHFGSQKVLGPRNIYQMFLSAWVGEVSGHIIVLLVCVHSSSYRQWDIILPLQATYFHTTYFT